MFEPPPTIPTRVFARVPEKYRKASPNPRWHVNHPGIDWTHSFLEGPAFDREGNLYCVDLAWGRIFIVRPDGEFDLVTEYDGEPNGLKIHADGRIFIADFRKGILLLDPATGAMIPVVDRYHMEPFKGVNDLFFASNGDLYFTDQGFSGLTNTSGRLFRITVGGTLQCVAQGIPSPNGVVLDNEESSVLLAVTRANAVWQLPVMPDGTLDRVGLFVQMSGGRGPDGLAMDVDGNLAVAHAGLGSVWLFDPVGIPIARVVSSEGNLTTNIAYGGPERRRLFITESRSGVILQAETLAAGTPMFALSDQR